MPYHPVVVTTAEGEIDRGAGGSEAERAATAEPTVTNQVHRTGEKRVAGQIVEPHHPGDQRRQLRCAGVFTTGGRGEAGQRYSVRVAVTAHGDPRRGPQHPGLAAVLHPRQARRRGRAEDPDLLLAQFHADCAALRDGTVREREPVLGEARRLGGERRAGRRQGQQHVRPVLAGALPDHCVGLQRQGFTIGHGPVGGAPHRAGGEVAQVQLDPPGNRGFHGQFDMADEFGGFLLGHAPRPFQLSDLDVENGQPGLHDAYLLAVRGPLVVDPVQLTGPAWSVGLSGARALTDVAQEIGSEPAQQIMAGAQPVAPLFQDPLFPR